MNPAINLLRRVSVANFAIVMPLIGLVLLNAGCNGSSGTVTTANLPPVGSLVATDLSPQSIAGPGPKTIQFTATFSDPEGKPVSATLQFGDGESTVLTTSGSVVTHTYTSQGYYQPLLILRDDLATRTVTVYVNNDSSFRVIVYAPLATHPLNVVVNGQGTVKSNPEGINCPGDCTHSFLAGSLVTLTETPSPGWAFSGWSGDCSGTIAEFPVPLNAPKNCTATFTQIRYSLNVTREGLGTVTSNPDGINCPPDCSEAYPSFSVVSLTATPDPGWIFGGWSDACSGLNRTVFVNMNADKSCKAIFTQTHQLNVAVNGQGTVTSNPPGINCPGDCGETYLSLTIVALTAQASPGWVFTGWSGDCTGTNSFFQITVNAFKSCTANFSPVYPVNVAVNGQGTVVSNPPGINCPGDCSELYVVNSVITLTANPAVGWAFAGWSGDCSGATPSTQVTVTSAKNCTANFGLARDLNVIINGEGSVTSDPAGINCPTDCSGSYLNNTAVMLTATPASGWVFDFWSGDCSGVNPSTSVVLSADKTCAANFLQLRYSLTVALNGMGTVASDPPGISCPGDCTESYLSNTEVTLTATPAPGWAFANWSGDCSGTSPVTQARLGSNRACTANFSQTPLLNVSLNGQGTVTSNPPGISCPGDCSEAYAFGATVTLTAAPASGWAFANWSGDCAGVNPSVQVNMTAVKNCTANFSQLQYSLNLTVTGQGTVTSNPPGISCPGDCSENYLSNSVITLTAAPASGWQFSQWTGDCAGVNPNLQVTLNTPKNCGATFTQLQYPVTVAIVGNGTVTSSPAGINCPADCTEPYLSNTVVTLTANPAAGWMFVSWSGDCSGVNPATQVTVNEAKLCTANFTELQYTLTVSLNGQGTVADVPPGGINCPPDCTEVYLDGTVVTLSATPAAGWTFVNWTGGCSGSNPTTQVTVNADKTCTANFTSVPRTLTVTINGTGTVTSNPAGITCPGDCTETYANGTVVTLTANSSAPWNFGSWSGDCSGTNPVTQVVMTGDRNCIATFATGPTTLFSDDFSSGLGQWTIVNGGTSSHTWTWSPSSPCTRSIGSPFVAPWAIADSDCAGPTPIMDEQMISPVLNGTGCTQVTLQFSNQFYYYPGGLSEKADVDVTNNGGATWINKLRMQGGSDGYPTANTKTVDITAEAAGFPAFQIRFHYWDAQWEWWWAVDNVKVLCYP